MKPLLCACLALLVLAACDPPTVPSAPDTDGALLETAFTKPPPTSALTLPPGYSASVFYDGIQGPDGIFVRTNSQLLVVREFREDEGVYLAKKGRTYSTADAFSTLGPPWVSPDDITQGSDGAIYVADGQAQTVFRVSWQGGAPAPFVTTGTTRGSFNPFGVETAPAGFDGPNVDPGDLIVSDNAYGGPDRAIWAVNPVTGVAKILAEGFVFNDGPIDMDFGPDGTLYVNENTGTSGGVLGPYRILTVAPDGTVSVVYEGEAERAELAVHPVTGEIFFMIEDGFVYRMDPGGVPNLFLSGLGVSQDFEFNGAGDRLYLSSRTLQQVVQVQAPRKVWLRK
jgi:hypothetical protein